MDLIKKFNSCNNSYSKKINSNSPYIEGNTSKVKYIGSNDICEIIIGDNEIEYYTLNNQQKTIFIKKNKLEIASNINKDNKYSKSFSISLLQKGFQNINHFSSILYLNDYYKIHCIIYNKDNNEFYGTSFKDYPSLICTYHDNKWNKYLDDIPSTFNINFNYKDLHNILTLDHNINIYKPYLGSISKYKLKDLEKICIDEGIPLQENGKKKLKKVLYDNINLKHINEDI